MITNNEPNDEVDENVVNEEATEINTRKKKTKCEYLRRQVEAKVENKSRKNIWRSFKDAFMTLKKESCKPTKAAWSGA